MAFKWDRQRVVDAELKIVQPIGCIGLSAFIESGSHSTAPQDFLFSLRIPKSVLKSFAHRGAFLRDQLSPVQVLPNQIGYG